MTPKNIIKLVDKVIEVVAQGPQGPEGPPGESSDGAVDGGGASTEYGGTSLIDGGVSGSF